MEIQQHLFALQDVAYRDFQAKLIPTVAKDRVIGVRTPAMKALAKQLSGSELATQFLEDLPHTYFDEDQLHAFLISLEKDFDTCIEAVDRFLPYVDNWATCDQLSPTIFKKHKASLLPHIDTWMASSHTYTVRFGIGMLMKHFLDADFEPAFLQRVAAVRSDEYYINMEIAWYFATALAKQYEEAIAILEAHVLDPWTHNKTIQKARESRRVSPEQKAYLKSLKY